MKEKYRPIIERKDADALLEKAADGKLILHAAIREHSATLFATPFAKVKLPSGGEPDRKSCAKRVPITVQTARDLMLFPDTTLESYLAVDPTQYPDTHPFADHLYFLDVPQTVTREQIYYRCDDEDAFETEPQTVTLDKVWSVHQNNAQAERSVKNGLSDAQKKHADKIESIRNLMKKEIDSGAWPRDKRGTEGLQSFVYRKHSVPIKREWGNVEYGTIRRKCSPCECKKLGIEPLPK